MDNNKKGYERMQDSNIRFSGNCRTIVIFDNLVDNTSTFKVQIDEGKILLYHFTQSLKNLHALPDLVKFQVGILSSFTHKVNLPASCRRKSMKVHDKMVPAHI